jgi:hypothetical protein
MVGVQLSMDVLKASGTLHLTLAPHLVSQGGYTSPSVMQFSLLGPLLMRECC